MNQKIDLWEAKIGNPTLFEFLKSLNEDGRIVQSVNITKYNISEESAYSGRNHNVREAIIIHCESSVEREFNID